MFDATQFEDGRGRYPDKLVVAVPRGTKDELRALAQREDESVPDIVRRLIGSAIKGSPAHNDSQVKA
jgi:hypothetical protein